MGSWRENIYVWTVLSTCFLLNIQVSFQMVGVGIFLMEFMEYFPVPKAEITIIGSFNLGVSVVIGLTSTHVIRYFGRRVYGLTAASLCTSGLLLSAYVNNLYFLYVSFGIIYGIGSSMYFVLANATSQIVVTKRRSLAGAIVVSAFSVGVFMWPAVCRWIIDAYCWQGALVVLATTHVQYIVLVLLLPTEPAKKTPVRDTEEFKETSMVTQRHKTELDIAEGSQSGSQDNIKTPDRRVGRWCRCKSVSAFCGEAERSWLPYSILYSVVIFFGNFMHIGVCSYIPARVWQLGHDKHQATLLLSIIGIFGIILRPLLGFLGDYKWMNRVLAQAFGTLIVGLVTALTRAFSQYTMLIVFAVLYGAGHTLYMSYYSVVSVDISGVQNADAGISMLLIGHGLACIVMHALAGVLLDIGGVSDLFMLFGASGVLSAGILLLVFFTRMFQARRQQSEKGDLHIEQWHS